jgi:uncharacterized protein (DUF1501 family)
MLLSTRRVFMRRGLALLAAAPTLPSFLNNTCLALEHRADGAITQQPSGKDGKILVVLQLAGGNDGLNTLVPYADDAYHRARPTLGVDPTTVHTLNDYVGLHPNLLPLTKLFEKGMASVIQGVGYPNPNRSHFRSTDIWESAQPDREVASSGWVGRYFDNTCSGTDPHPGISMGAAVPLAMQGEKITPLAFERPESYRYRGPDVGRYLKLNQASVPDSAAGIAQSQLEFLHRTAMDAQVSSEAILRVTTGQRPDPAYPAGEFGLGLQTVAAMIGGGLSTRVYYVSMGGFDTHANERGRHDQLMKQFGMGIDAFWREMASQGNADRVLMMTFSEFGRRVQQNASGGTDHGAAAPMFVFGGGIKGGVVGEHPSLTNLDHGDLRFTTDFRSVYAAVLENWLQTPSKPILGGDFTPLPLFKA